MSNGIYGDTTRELRLAWINRVGPLEQRTSSDQMLQSLFNDLNLYPSQSQIFEMVQCARECSNHLTKLTVTKSSELDAISSCRSSHGSLGQQEYSQAGSSIDKNLTFGEFCVFATELRKYYNQHEKQQPPSSHMAQGTKHCRQRRTELRTQKSSASVYDMFLGGSCNPTSWRQDIAIPHLKHQGITYYNPQQSNWVPEMIELEHQAKQTSQLLFFVLNDMTRNVVSMIEVAYLAGAQRRLIVVINPYPAPGHKINGESMSTVEFTDLNNALTTVHDLVERQGLPVFSDISVALSCSTKVLKEEIQIEELGLKDNAQPVKLAHLQIGDKLVRLREAFDTLDTNRAGQISLADIKMAFRIHAHRDLSQRDLQQILAAHDVSPKGKSNSLPLDQVMIDFDHFCCIVSEFKHTKGLISGEGGRNGDLFHGKASHFFHNVLRPFQKLTTWIGSPFSRRGRSSSSNRCTPSSGTSPLTSTNLKQRRGSQIRDIYLGGTMKGSKWREKEAIPMLKKHGLTFFNPQVSSSCSNSSSTSSTSSSSSSSFRSRRLIPIEAAAMDNSRVLLFVILGNSRSVGVMCEAAYYIGKGASVVLCVQKIQENCPIENGEQLSKCALKDYNRGRAYLSDIANREGVPVFEEIHEAIECILQKCKNLK